MKLCINCTHYAQRVNPSFAQGQQTLHHCTRSEHFVDTAETPVTGRKARAGTLDCVLERLEQPDTCGQDAKFFIQKEED